MSNRMPATANQATNTRAHGAQPAAMNTKHDNAPGFEAERNRTRRFSEHSDSSDPGCLERGGATTAGVDRSAKSQLSHDFDNLMSDLGWHIERAGTSLNDSWNSALDESHAALPDLRKHWDALCAKVGSQFESLGSWGDGGGAGQHHADDAVTHSNEAVEAVRVQGGIQQPVAGGHAARQHHATMPEQQGAEATAQRMPAAQSSTRRLV
ncbi:uncharacterized protein LOC62_02G002377 [Vanrija pseudolonga]|uniref:Uncharacterized protein n=1 Tax=Vanrija pseudolonga TaxID=143232 RepID=A0AAF1BP41_9TREE|nr:hypothetical protein LOC62_02G002377 [Vanrija pseudolonga]